MGGIPSAIDLLKQRDQRITELEAALRGVERVCMDVLQDRSKHDVEILLGTLMGLHSHVIEKLGEGDSTP